MFNKELYNKIINASCMFEELQAFVTNLDKKEFDVENAFEKYYNLQRILYAIKRYEDKEINDKYLSYWMTAYCWIIMGGFKTEYKNREITFQEWIEWEIADRLDSLSFFDDSYDWYNLDEYKNSFTTIDKIYQTISEWKRVFAHTDEWGDNEDDVVFLVHNDKTKEFVKIDGELDYLNKKVDIDRIEFDELEKQIEQLKKEGYQELKYGTFVET